MDSSQSQSHGKGLNLPKTTPNDKALVEATTRNDKDESLVEAALTLLGKAETGHLLNSTVVNLAESRQIVQGDIDEEAEELNNRILSDLHEIAEAFQEHYNSSKMNLGDVQELPDKFATEHNAISQMIEVISNSKTTNELVRGINDCANALDITVPKESLIDIANQGRYLEFLKNVNKELEIGSSSWADPFHTVSEYLYQSQKWYTFLNALLDKFSEYEIQKDRQKYNVANLDDWGKTGTPRGINITAASYNEFLNKIAKFNVSEQDNVKNITLTILQLEELNHVLNLTLKPTFKIKCEDSSMIVSGSYYVAEEKIDADLDEICQQSLFKNITSPGMFLLNKFFVNGKDSQSMTFLFAPEWEVVNKTAIEVRGVKGESHLTPFSFFHPRTTSQAANGTRPGARGDDGKPGGPGGPTGFFLGIGDRFVNGENLTIKVIGGEGGDGQHGGDGYSANNGANANVPSERERCQKICNVNYFHCVTISYIFTPGRCSGAGKSNCTSDEYYCKYKIFGFPGNGVKSVSDGGNGGRGGRGAAPGNITLFELGGDSGIVKVAERGKDGDNGHGGRGGLTGYFGNHLIVSFDSKVSSKWKWEGTIKHSSGKNGIDGGNAAGMVDPKPPYTLKNPAKLVNKYKSYLRENMMDRFTKTRRVQFLEKINSDERINSIYDMEGFIDEFEGLEKQFHSLSKEVDIVPFYQALLPRISEYSKSPKGYDKSNEHKKVLNFLYTAILGRINNLKEDSESNLIINVGGYLDIVKREIATLRDLQKVKNKAEVIGRYQKRYKDNLDKKIDEARSILDKLLTPEMANISKNIDKKIDLLIDETIELQKKVEKDKEALIKKKQELERTMALRGLFSCLSIFGAVLSFFGPVGAIVGTVIGTTSSVAESLVLDNQQQGFEIPPDVVPNIKILGDQIKSVREKKVKHLGNLLEEISQEIGKNPKTLGDMSDKISDMKNRLNKVKENGYSSKEIKTLESELKQELKNKEGQLKIKEPDLKTKGALKVVEKLSQAAQLGTLLVDIYNKHKNDQEKVDAITNAIQESEDKIQKLKLYEEQIYEVIAPTLHNMENNLQDVASKLESKSQVSLEVTKWKVQSTLKDMKKQMQQLTEGFKVKDDLARCIEKLDEVMTTLINVYDRMQNYQDQQNLADYIADISSSSASSINISNPNLVKIMNNLETLVSSNVVLTQYKAAVNAFKQWVFPFAKYYLEESMLPSSLELEKNIENLVDSAVKQVESLKSKLDLYKTSVKKTDKYIQKGEFSSRYISTEPFYVWKNSEYKDVISKLLSGQKVVLKADVRDAAPDKDAIKFSVMELYFKTNNETLQSEMNYLIKGFDVMATHMGNSYYRYADKIYVITSDSQTIVYSCEKTVAGEPVRKNIVFDKIKDGDLMLSPYTLWEIKMINSTRKITFHDLETYKEYVDLELSGYGSYVRENLNELKFAGKEYRSIGRFDEVSVCLESEVRNSRKCTDLTKHRIGYVHQMEELDDYMINGVAPSLWSPFNDAINFFKLHIASNFVQFFIDRMKNINKNNHGGISEKLSTNLKSMKKEKSRSTERNARRAELQRNGIIENENSKSNCIDVQSFTFNGQSELRSGLLSNGEKWENSCFSQPFEVNCTLLLADVVSRTVTGNKYKQPVEECLLSPNEKLQIILEESVVRSEEDAKRHLRNLSRMPDERESSWLNGVKNYAKSVFQYLGLDKRSGPDDFVEDIRTLFT